MHELSVCQALVAEVESVARAHGAAAVKTVKLRVGPLSGVEPSLLEQAYPLACAGTLAERSVLAIELAPVRVCCEGCGAETDAAPARLLCGQCGDHRTRLVSGDEMVLMSVELALNEA